MVTPNVRSYHVRTGLLLDSAGAAIAHAAAFMTLRQGIVLFAFSTLKTVDDHGGYALPWYIDPLHLIFPNTAEYHVSVVVLFAYIASLTHLTS